SWFSDVGVAPRARCPKIACKLHGHRFRGPGKLPMARIPAKWPSPLNLSLCFAIRAFNRLPVKVRIGGCCASMGALAAYLPELQINQRVTDVFDVRHNRQYYR